MVVRRSWLILFMAALSFASKAHLYTLPAQGDIIGKQQTVFSKPHETLASIAERFSMGQEEMQAANPSIQFATAPLKPDTLIQIPSQFKLPPGPRTGLVIDLAHKRAYYYHPNGTAVSTYPIGIGRQGWETPTGQTTVVAKEIAPIWHPPASIRQEAAHLGHPLSLLIPPGPHNPLGHYAIRLGMKGILIHGTLFPSTVGLRSSHGCLRLYAQDLEALFELIPLGTIVYLINGTTHGK